MTENDYERFSRSYESVSNNLRKKGKESWLEEPSPASNHTMLKKKTGK